MKKYMIIGGVGIGLVSLASIAWMYSLKLPFLINQNTSTVAKIHTIDKNLGGDFKGNFVWGGAMNLAWNELNENILKENLKLKTDDPDTLKMVESFNNPTFTKNDLDEESYYIKSGYGQETINSINRDSRKKFPSKSFGELNINLGEKQFISYAYFLKEVKYLEIFEKKELFFNKEKVKGFYASSKYQGDTVKILKYENDDTFIISIRLKDSSDQLILAKGYEMNQPQLVVNEMNQYNGENLESMGENDIFEAPLLRLDHQRDYKEIIGKGLLNKDFENYLIAGMSEKIKFNMNEAGARVENEAVIFGTESAMNPVERPKPKRLILDAPYWVIMKRKDSFNPYFILGVNNTALMEKVAFTKDEILPSIKDKEASSIEPGVPTLQRVEPETSTTTNELINLNELILKPNQGNSDSISSHSSKEK